MSARYRRVAEPEVPAEFPKPNEVVGGQFFFFNCKNHRLASHGLTMSLSALGVSSPLVGFSRGSKILSHKNLLPSLKSGRGDSPPGLFLPTARNGRRQEEQKYTSGPNSRTRTPSVFQIWIFVEFSSYFLKNLLKIYMEQRTFPSRGLTILLV